MYRWGFLGWMVLDFETGEMVVRWSLVLLLVSVGLWAVGLAGLAWLTVRISREVHRRTVAAAQLEV